MHKTIAAVESMFYYSQLQNLIEDCSLLLQLANVVFVDRFLTSLASSGNDIRNVLYPICIPLYDGLNCRFLWAYMLLPSVYPAIMTPATAVTTESLDSPYF